MEGWVWNFVGILWKRKLYFLIYFCMQTKTQTSSLFPEDFAHSPDKECFRGIFGKGKRAFTLVELIIVITILAILATIAFVSYQWYSSQSRDANRVSTVKNIENGAQIFFTKTGKVPEPDDVVWSGKLTPTWPVLNIVWKVWTSLVRSINMNEVPKDPRADEQYWYWVDVLWRYFQVWLTLESETAYTPWVNSIYADAPLVAQVQGNYEYPLVLKNVVYSPPSLLFLGTGGVLNNQTEFVVDEGSNVPYTFWQSNTSTQSVTEVLNIITGTWNVTLTGVSLPSMSITDYKGSSTLPSAFSWISQALGISDRNKLWVVVYWKEYVWGGVTSGGTTQVSPDNSCDESTKPTDNGHIIIVVGTPTGENQTYVQGVSNCGYSCKDGYTGSGCGIAPLITVTSCTWSAGRSYALSYTTNSINVSDPWTRASVLNVRCFKN